MMNPRWPTLTCLAVLAVIPVGCGDDDDGGSTTSAPSGAALKVDMSEFKFTPDSLEADAGEVTISATNKGKTEHELVLLRTESDPAKLPTKDGEVDESTSVGEIPEVPAGRSDTKSFDLDAGRYVMVCALPGHYENGMHGTLTVR